jgi:hypothetical protein
MRATVGPDIDGPVSSMVRPEPRRYGDWNPADSSRRRGLRRGHPRDGTMSWERREDHDEEAVRCFVEAITRRIDSSADVLLREPGRPADPRLVRFALLRSGQAIPFDVSEPEWRDARSPLGRERLARRIGAALGLQPPDQMSGPPRD